jgi:hypothetical protein
MGRLANASLLFVAQSGGAQMFAGLAWGKVKPGMWDRYEQLYHDGILPKTREVKGLRFRELLCDTDDPNAGISLTLWETRADLDAYDGNLRKCASDLGGFGSRCPPR